MGVVLKAKVGDSVKKGDPIVVIHSNTEDISEVKDKLTKAFKISDHSEPIQLIVDTINHA